MNHILRTFSVHRLFSSRLRALLAVLVLVVLSAQGRASAQEPPRFGPRISATFPISAPPAQYDIVQQLVELRPGAFAPEHTHGGPAHVTVIEGRIVRETGGVQTSYEAGQSFVELPGQFNYVGNPGPGTARVMASFLLSPGAPITINNPNRALPEILPITILLSGRMTVTTQPAEFNLRQSIVDFEPGAYRPPSPPTGRGLHTVIAGEFFMHYRGQELRLKVGDSFRDEGFEFDARNTSSQTSTSMVTTLTPVAGSAPPAASVAAGSPAPPRLVRPPSAGDGGLADRRSSYVIRLAALTFILVIVGATRVLRRT
jgi:quercetin dioxygenase-like cupin family protein